MAHIRQSRPDSGLGFQAKVLETFKVFPLRSEAVLNSTVNSTFDLTINLTIDWTITSDPGQGAVTLLRGGGIRAAVGGD
jgi:hypothetical protein